MSWENLIKDQSIFALVIILLILITFSFDNLWILLGENWCWSPLGLKGLNNNKFDSSNKTFHRSLLINYKGCWWKATKAQFIQSLMCFCPTCQTYSWITFNKSLAQARHLNQFLNLIRQVNQVQQQGLWHGSDSNIMAMPR